MRTMRSGRTCTATFLAAALALLGAPPGAAGGEPAPEAKGSQEESGKPSPKKSSAGKGAASQGSKKARKDEKPVRIKLPEAGERAAAELFPLVEKLWGLPVVPASPMASEVKVRILEELAGQMVGMEEISVLLAAFGVYLFPHERKEGTVLVATTNPRWKPGDGAPRIVGKFQVRRSSFEAAKKEIQGILDAWNKEKAPGELAATMAADPRTGWIIVQASTEKLLEKVQEAVSLQEKPSKDSMHLYTFAPLHRKAADLQEELLDSLSEGEKRRFSAVIPTGKNILLIRAPESLWKKIEGILRSRDTPKSPAR